MSSSDREGERGAARRLALAKDNDCIYSDAKSRERVIDKYVGGRLSGDKRNKFEQHYFSCDICFRELQIREGIVTVTRQREDMILAESVKDEAEEHGISRLDSFISRIKEFFSVRWLSAGLAFAAALLLIMLGKGLWESPNLEEQRRLFAANSTPSPFMESLLEGSRRAGSLTVVSPRNGFNVRDHLRFTLEGDDLTGFTIIILNNREDELFTFVIPRDQYLFENAADQLQPGLYYWKLEDEEEVRHVGKFFVNKPD